MSVLVITRGLPASGKTTFARSWVASVPAGERARVNRDDLRAMIHNGVWNGPATERSIVLARNALISALLVDGLDVICDDTNVHYKVVDLVHLGRSCGAAVQLADLTGISAAECIRRDTARPISVGPVAIRELAQVMAEANAMPQVAETLSMLTRCPDAPSCLDAAGVTP